MVIRSLNRNKKHENGEEGNAAVLLPMYQSMRICTRDGACFVILVGSRIIGVNSGIQSPLFHGANANVRSKRTEP